MILAAFVASFGAEAAVQQPRRVEHVRHKHPEQQLSERAPSVAAVGGVGITGRKHGSCGNKIIS